MNMNNYQTMDNYPKRRLSRRQKRIIAVSALIAILAILPLLPVKWGIIVYDTLLIGNIEYDSDHQFQVSSNIFYKVTRGASGAVEYYEGANVITNAALTALRPYISDTPGNPFLYIAVGTGSGGGAGSTQLQTQYSTRGLGTYSVVSAYVFKVVYTFTAGFFSDTTITETGLFDASTSGTMFNYHDFTGIFLSSADSLEMTHQITLASA
jgi:hypothetical protein